MQIRIRDAKSVFIGGVVKSEAGIATILYLIVESSKRQTPRLYHIPMQGSFIIVPWPSSSKLPASLSFGPTVPRCPIPLLPAVLPQAPAAQRVVVVQPSCL